MNKKEIAMAQTVMRLYNSKTFSVNDAYQRPSTTKQAIENDILTQYYNKNGFCYKVISYNVFFFTCGYFYEHIDIDTGEVLVKMRIHKPSGFCDYDVSKLIEVNQLWKYGTFLGYEYQPTKYCKELLTVQAN